MKIDKADLDIVDLLYDMDEEKRYTTTYIARQVFDSSETSIQTLDNRVRYRLERLEDNGIVEVLDEQKPTTYRLKYEDIIFGKAEVKLMDAFEEDFEFVAQQILCVSKDDGVHIKAILPHDEEEDVEEEGSPIMSDDIETD